MPAAILKLAQSALLMAAFAVAASPATLAQQTATGPHGGTATGKVTREGATATASGTPTSARGNTVSGSGSATKTAKGLSGSGSVTGPKGGTTEASGTATNNANGSTTVSGTATVPRGQSKSGSVTGTPKSPASTAPGQPKPAPKTK